MNLLKKWRKQNDGENRALVKHGRSEEGLARIRDFRDKIDNAFDRIWRQWDRDPWSALKTLPQQFGSLAHFGGGLANWPAVDMAEDEKSVTLRVDVPGLDEKDLDVEVSGNLLSIRGSRQDEWDENKHGVRRRERISGSFARTLTLPSYVDAQKIEARYDKGTLHITVPKVPGQGPKRVRILPG